MRVLALTVVAVGVGLTFSTTSAHADPSTDNGGHGHTRATKTDRTANHRSSALDRTSKHKLELGKTLQSTVSHTSKAVSKTVRATTSSLTGNSANDHAGSGATNAGSGATNKATASTTSPKGSGTHSHDSSGTPKGSHDDAASKIIGSADSLTHKTFQTARHAASKAVDHAEPKINKSSTSETESSTPRATTTTSGKSTDADDSATQRATSTPRHGSGSTADKATDESHARHARHAENAVHDSVKAVDKTLRETAATADRILDKTTNQVTDRTVSKAVDQLAPKDSHTAASAPGHDSPTGTEASKTQASTTVKVSGSAAKQRSTGDQDSATHKDAVTSPEVSTDDGERSTALGTLINDAVLTPTASLVSTVGQAHPVGQVLDTTTDVLHATAEPTELVPTLVGTVSKVTPKQLRPIVDQTGDTATQMTAPVTKIIGAAETAVEPAVPVRDVVNGVADQVVTPVNDQLGSRVDHALPVITDPVTRTVGGVGDTVEAIAPLPLPAQPVRDLHEGLEDVTGGLSAGLTEVSHGVADGMQAVTVGVTPVTDVVDQVSDHVSTAVVSTGRSVTTKLPSIPLPDVQQSRQPMPVASQPRSPVRPSYPALGVAPTRMAVTATDSPAASMPALNATHRSAPIPPAAGTTASVAGPEQFTIELTGSTPAAQIISAVGDSAPITAGHSETIPETTPVTDSAAAVSFIPTAGTASNSSTTSSAGASANAGSSGAAQPVSTPVAMTILDSRGADRILWEHQVGIVRAPYDPGFSPD